MSIEEEQYNRVFKKLVEECEGLDIYNSENKMKCPDGLTCDVVHWKLIYQE